MSDLICPQFFSFMMSHVGASSHCTLYINLLVLGFECWDWQCFYKASFKTAWAGTVCLIVDPFSWVQAWVAGCQSPSDRIYGYNPVTHMWPWVRPIKVKLCLRSRYSHGNGVILYFLGSLSCLHCEVVCAPGSEIRGHFTLPPWQMAHDPLLQSFYRVSFMFQWVSMPGSHWSQRRLPSKLTGHPSITSLFWPSKHL